MRAGQRRLTSDGWRLRAWMGAGRLALALPMLALGAYAQAQTSTSFDYGDQNGGFLQARTISLFGDAVYSYSYNGPGSPTYGAIEITPNESTGNFGYGAMYYTPAIDLSKGFSSTFYVPNVSNQGFAFVIKNVNETSAVNPAGRAMGYNGFKYSVAVAFDFATRVVSLEVPVNDFLSHRAANVLVSAPLPAPPSGFGNIFLGHVALRYSPKSKLLDVYIENRLILRAKDFLLDDYKVLDNGLAKIGFVGGSFTALNGTDSQPTLIQAWALGNNLNTMGINDNFYSELMTFKTTGQSLWGPDSDSAAWNSGNQFIKTYSSNLPPQHGDSGGFSGDFNARFDNNGSSKGVGLRFEAKATGGTADITYPLNLDLLFPRQQTVAFGEHFEIASSYDPDYSASLNTQSPSAGFKTFFTFNTRNYADFHVGFPKPFNSLNFGSTLLNFTTSVDDKEVFDTDFILNNASAFGIVKGGAEKAVSLQDDEGVKGPKSSHRGTPGEGSTKGAGKDVNPLDFISLNLFLPNLAANGNISLDAASPTLLTGNAQSNIVGLHSDFTSALLALADLETFSNVINFDGSFDLGAGNTYALGWHFADLYGDLNFGVKLTHNFTPAPHVRLHFTDVNGNKALDSNNLPLADMDYDLNADGSPIDSPAIPMTFLPLVVTPTVFLYNPSATSANRQKAYNTFSTSASLVIDGDLNLNAFQMYLQAGDIDLDTGPIGYQTPIPSYISPTLGETTFQMKDFNVVTGHPFTLLPKDSKDPLIQSVTPRAGLRAVSSAGTTLLTLKCLNISSSAGVVWDRSQPAEKDLSGNFSVDSATQVRVFVPNNLLTQRGPHTLTVINGITDFNPTKHFPSNAVTYTIDELAPRLNTLSPEKIGLSTPPTDLSSGKAILQDGSASNKDALNEQHFELTVTGSNFVNALAGLPGSIVRWNGMALPTKFFSASRLIAYVPAAYLAKADTVKITVFTAAPGGGESQALPLEMRNPLPVAARLSPSTSFAGAARMTTMVIGSSFVRTSQVLWNGNPRPTTFFSSQQLEVELSDNDLKTAGAATVSVTNGGNLLSKGLTFTTGVTPIRTILQITPTLTRDAGNGDVVITLVIKNIGSSVAQGLSLGALTVTGANNKTTDAQPVNTTLPSALGDLATGQSVSISGSFHLPGTVGGKGDAALLNVYGAFSNGPFTTRKRISLP